MKPGRNQPCPCGSGKKYKKCCYLKDRAVIHEGDNAVQHEQENQSDNTEAQEMLVRLLRNMRKNILDTKPHIKNYHKARKMHEGILNAMIRHFEEGKFEQKVTSDFRPNLEREPELCLLECEFDFNTREGLQAFYDMLIYKPAPNMNCITEEFIQKHRYRKPEKVDFLHSMLNSKLGLFEITGVDYNEGFVHIKDVFSGDAYTIIDVGLSGQQHYGDFYLYTRVIQYQGTCFSSGLNLVFSKTEPFIKKHIQNHKNTFSTKNEFVRFTQLYNHFSKHPGKIKVVHNAL